MKCRQFPLKFDWTSAGRLGLQCGPWTGLGTSFGPSALGFGMMHVRGVYIIIYRIYVFVYVSVHGNSTATATTRTPTHNTHADVLILFQRHRLQSWPKSQAGGTVRNPWLEIDWNDIAKACWQWSTRAWAIGFSVDVDVHVGVGVGVDVATL